MDGGMTDIETLSLLALLQRDRARWADIRAAIEERKASDLLKEAAGTNLLEDLFGDAIAAVRRQVVDWAGDGIDVHSVYSETYPSQLRSVHDFPPVLFSRGQRLESDLHSIAVVGTRKPSAPATKFIEETIPLIAEAGFPVVSGLARGVDSIAIRSSLEAGNRTVAVIGTGLRRTYPAENAALQEEIATRHLLLSQFWPDAPPTKQSFPMRNHVMSAYSSMTVIVEASENSGTRIQARAATKHARPLIITRAVLVQTNWAKDLVARGFDVTVVSSPDEAIRAITEIASRRERPRAWAERALQPVGA
jgi:DNA processing protein